MQSIGWFKEFLPQYLRCWLSDPSSCSHTNASTVQRTAKMQEMLVFGTLGYGTQVALEFIRKELSIFAES